MIMEKTVLVLIDIQNIYFTKGKYLLHEPLKAAKAAHDVLEIFRKENMPVIHVKHSFKTDGYEEDSVFLNDIHEAVYPAENEIIVDKNYPNAFLNTKLSECLDKLDAKNLVIAGMMSHMCVDTTVRACQDYGYKVTVISDACTTKALQWNGNEISAETVHVSYMAGLNGMFADVISLNDLEKYFTRFQI